MEHSGGDIATASGAGLYWTNLRGDRPESGLDHPLNPSPRSYDRPATSQRSISEALDAGFRHIIPGLPAPYPENVAHWIVSDLVTPSP